MSTSFTRIIRPASPAARPLAAAPPLAAADRLLAALTADRDRWEPLIRYRADERWYTRLPVDDLVAEAGVLGPVEAWLLTWLPGQRTGLHDHGGSAGAFGVVRGAIREDTAGRSGGRPLLASRTVGAGDRRAFGPRHLHEIINTGDAPAVSLHVYAPGLTQMTRYRWTDDGPAVLAVEQAGADW